MPRVSSAAATHVGRRISETRKALGLTQDEVGVRSQIDSANVRAYENGRAMPSVHSLVRIAWALDVSAGHLLDGLTPEHFELPDGAGRRRAG